MPTSQQKIVLVSFVLLLATAVLLRGRSDGLLSEVQASTEESSIRVRCEAPPVTAYIPQVTYEVFGSGSTLPQIQLSLSGAVNEDWIPEVRNQGYQSGVLRFSHRTPTMKLSGLFCRPDNEASLSVSGGVSNERSGVEIFADRPYGHSSRQISLNDARMHVLFGHRGSFMNHPLKDGDDFDSLRNGEVVFGGDQVQHGGSETVFHVSLGKEVLILRPTPLTFHLNPSQGL